MGKRWARTVFFFGSFWLFSADTLHVKTNKKNKSQKLQLCQFSVGYSDFHVCVSLLLLWLYLEFHCSSGESSESLNRLTH